MDNPYRITPEEYRLWAELWKQEHPTKVPPALSEVRELQRLLGFTTASLFGVPTSEELQ